MAKELRPIAFLPWLNLTEEVKLGNVVFWPYEKMKGTLLPDGYSVEQMDRYAQIYRISQDKPAPVTCVSYRVDSNRNKLTPSQSVELFRARYALFASAYINGLTYSNLDNLSSFLPSTEHFTMYPIPNKEGVAKGNYFVQYPKGAIVGVISGFHNDMPNHLFGVFNISPYSLFRPMLKALSISLAKPKISNVWKSLEWFFYAHTTQEHFTEESRLVMLCIAIESMINENTTARIFTNKVGAAVAHLNLSRRWRQITLNSKNTKKQRVCWNRLEKWAWDFYNLRNNIIHSNTSSKISLVWNELQFERFNIRYTGVMHYLIASYVWFECLWDTLSNSGIVPPKPNGNNLRIYMKWYCTWQSPIKDIRKRWKEFFTGKINNTLDC